MQADVVELKATACNTLLGVLHNLRHELRVWLSGMQLWFDLFRAPSGREADLLEEVLASWFMLGRLGAYNAQNLQVPALLCALSTANTILSPHHWPVHQICLD